MSDTLPELFDDEVKPTAFDYRILPTEKREFVLQKTDETQWLLKKTAENIIKIGKNLLAVKDILPHGAFSIWIGFEFGMTQRTAVNFMHVAEKFDGKTEKFSVLSSSVLYLLSAPATPDSAIDETIRIAESGQKVTHAMAQKIIELEKAKEQAEQERAEAIANSEITQQRLLSVEEEAQAKVSELTSQVASLKQEMTTLTTPEVQIQEKEVLPPSTIQELDSLHAEIERLAGEVEQQKKAVPLGTQKEIEALKKQLDKLKSEQEQRDLELKARDERIRKLNEDIDTTIRKKEIAENADRTRQGWRLITSEVHACLMRLLGQWPTPIDVQVFDADDWARVDHLRETMKRVITECDSLRFDGDSMVVDVDASPFPVMLRD